MRFFNKTKIIATLGPASNNEKTLKKMIRFGLDIVRINGTHAEKDQIKKDISMVRSVSAKERVNTGILIDLPGPKIRIGKLKKEPIIIKPGKTITLVCGRTKQIADEIPVPYKNLEKDLKKGSKIFLNDGIIELNVIQIKGNKVLCKILSGGELRSKKGVNLPNTALHIPALTKKDKEVLKVAIEEEVDFVGLSFVRSAKNIMDLRKLLKKTGIQIIAKIEKPEALTDIDNIIEVADAIMVARGDLGIEISHDKIPGVQKELLLKCHLAGIPSITATQILESMITAKTPTRAEATDVANAVWEGSDAVMLSAETSIGRYPEFAVYEMSKIAFQAEKSMPEFPKIHKQKNESIYQAHVISKAAGQIARDLQVKAIVTPTRSGTTALLVSKQRPDMQIIAPTSRDKTARRMSLYWGVRPMIMPNFESVDDLLRYTGNLALRYKVVKKYDKIVITSGSQNKKEDTTRLVQVRTIGES